MIRYEPFSLRLASPLDTAAGRIDERTGFLVHVDREGGYGLGEATPLPGWTESSAACEAALSEADVGSLPEADGSDEDSRLATPAARHGIELARADAEARAADESLAAWLSDGPPAEAVPVNATVGDGSVGATAAETQEAVASGYPAVKVKVGARDPDTDEARLRAVRDAAGDGTELRADANGAWDVETAERLLDVAADLDFSYVEQPLSATDLAGHAALRGRGVDIALDESLATFDYETVFDRDAADVIVCKPMVLGGPKRTLDIAERAAEDGIDTVVTTTIDAVVARTGGLHVAAALPERRACGLATGDRFATDLAPDPAPVQEGRMSVPSGPGLAGEAFASLRTR